MAAFNFKVIRNNIMRTLFESVFNTSSGHDHDGTNSKAVTVGTVADLAITDAKLHTNVKVGAVGDLTTTSKTNVVGAINELDGEVGDLTTLTTSVSTDLVSAINEIDTNADAAVVTANNAASVAALADAAADAATAAVSSAASLTGAQTLTNKTLTAPKIATTDAICDAGGDELLKFVEAGTPVTYIQVTSGNAGVAPKVQGAGETNADLHLLGSGTGNVYISDGADPTKDINFELSGATNAKTMTIISSQTDDRAITLPDATDTLVGKATTDVLSNKTLTTPKIVTTGAICDAGGDEYLKFVEATTPVTYVQITSGDTGVAPKVQAAGETNIDLHLLGSGTGNVYISDGTDPTKDINFELNGATTAKTMTIVSSQTDDRALTLPDATDTLIGKATTDTLTNKILDSLGTGNHIKNTVLAYAADVTRAEMITGKTLVAGVAGRTIRVLNYRMVVTGAFNGGAGTSLILQDTNGTPVVITTALKAGLTDGARISSYGLAIANVTDGAGLTGNLTASAGIEVAADAAWDAGTSVYIVVEYMYV